jgi:23S rRNA (cytosine1962-C5)-methyltransferase
MTNAAHSGVEKAKIRFLADDANKFVKREIRRKRRYHGILLDPPTFGRGTKGEVWKIERDLFKLITAARELLASNAAFVLLTSHSPGITPAVLRGCLSDFGGQIESGEMLLLGRGPALSAGSFARWIP